MLKLAASLLGLIAGALAYYAWFVEPYRLVIRRRTIEVHGLDPSAGPITILHLSDLHMKSGEHRKARILEPLKELYPDLIIVTGDFVQSTKDAPYCAEVLRGLRAKHGIVGVLGNHDHFRYAWWGIFRRTRQAGGPPRGHMPNDVRDIIRALEGAGIKLIVNANLRLTINGQEIWLVGVDDPYHHRDNLAGAMIGVPGHGAKVLLAHSPDILDEATKSGFGLVFSGHTHGGQVRLPWIGALVTRTRKPLERPSGVISRNGTIAHISPGIGGGTLTLRFLCPPEATIVELRPVRQTSSQLAKAPGY